MYSVSPALISAEIVWSSAAGQASLVAVASCDGLQQTLPWGGLTAEPPHWLPPLVPFGAVRGLCVRVA